MSSIVVEAAHAADQPDIEHLLDLTFGLSRLAKTSYRLREGNTADRRAVPRHARGGLWALPVPSASGRSRSATQGSDALLLGPLAVHPGAAEYRHRPRSHA